MHVKYFAMRSCFLATNYETMRKKTVVVIGFAKMIITTITTRIMKAVSPENVPVVTGKCENYNSGMLGLIAVVVKGEIGSKPELLDIYAIKLVSNVSDR